MSLHVETGSHLQLIPEELERSEDMSTLHKPDVPDADSVGDKECAICMERPREAGFVHGGTMHMIVCRQCVGRVAVGDPCPMCRVPVEHVVSAIF